MKILITGSGGFVGGSVGRHAARLGHQVLGVARRSQPDADWPGGHAAADVATADLVPVLDAFRPDAIFHGAGTASVGASLTDPLADFRAAALTWANVLDAVRRSGLTPTVVFPSSAAVYGNPERLPVTESASVRPISPYGYHKAAAELLAREYAACFGLRVVICRVFSVLGPAQRRLLAWDIYRRFVGPAAVVELDGTGEECRDYVHIDDLADAVIGLAAASGHAAEPLCFNVASGRATRVAEMTTLIGRQLGSNKPVRFCGNVRVGDPARWQGDNAALAVALPTWRSRPVPDALTDCLAAWHKTARPES